MKKQTIAIIIFLLLAASASFAQNEGTPVNQVDAPAPRAVQKILVYSGANLSYICWALATQPYTSASIAISAASNAAAVEFTSAAHGLDSNSLPTVTVSGGTGNWVAVNGTRTATITGADTFTVPVDSSALGAVAGTLVFTTRAPRKGQSVWAVQKFTYDGASNLTGAFWVGGSTAFRNACASPTQYQ